MTDFSVKDGTGSGRRAKVDDNNRLHTAATTRTRSSAASEEGQAYGLATPDYYILTPNHEFGMIYFENRDPDNDFHINKFFFSWDGGASTGESVLKVRGYKGASGPSAHNLDNENYPSIGPGNLNYGSPRTAQCDYHIWNGATGAGMLLTASGTKNLAAYFAKGVSELQVDGTIQLPYGSSIFITAASAETGYFSLIISGWYQTVGEQ